MSEPDDSKQKLVDRIKTKRAGVNAFAHGLERRGGRLTNLSIACASLTTLLTAGPALGGTKFTDITGSLLGLANHSIVWQVLCLGAVVLSIAAAIIENLKKATENTSLLTKAQITGMLLEKLEMSLEFGQVEVDVAAKQFQEYLAGAPFIPEKNTRS